MAIQEGALQRMLDNNQLRTEQCPAVCCINIIQIIIKLKFFYDAMHILQDYLKVLNKTNWSHEPELSNVF